MNYSREASDVYGEMDLACDMVVAAYRALYTRMRRDEILRRAVSDAEKLIEGLRISGCLNRENFDSSFMAIDLSAGQKFILVGLRDLLDTGDLSSKITRMKLVANLLTIIAGQAEGEVWSALVGWGHGEIANFPAVRIDHGKVEATKPWDRVGAEARGRIRSIRGR